MGKDEEGWMKKGEVAGSMIYVLAKLGYSRSEVEKITQELRRLFDLSCNRHSFETSLDAGRVERRNMLPTVDSSKRTR
ncbi:hypothetical protein [Hazenella coriacea]|uniref:Uncharacterized protein n=1 Tax=Hazenella coriacea TaxID=1179467 RepID=A0A4R3L8G9_9BACL|nr:hypothetical protein [Hazenella coriacea]TCS95458.1 hypothetical protein EDD58_10228 [Hazenella coriacea]